MVLRKAKSRCYLDIDGIDFLSFFMVMECFLLNRRKLY